MNKDTVRVALIWLALTVLGEVAVVRWELFPLAAAAEAEMVDRAFRVLLVLSMPVLAFVIAVLGYSVARFRSHGPPASDGPPVHTHRPWVIFWFVWTTALTILVIIHPGVTGLRELRHEAGKPVDLVVDVQGGRWYWLVSYPEQGVSNARELVLPVDKHVRFDITARDVLHAFWIPGFRVKIDAVPGMVTRIHATPTERGSFSDNDQLRLQCAELCGVAHSAMTMPVRVVSQADFDEWVAAQARQARKP
ncbi:MAG: cytochrome c oxidase subunit II [SAR202 cluster bacterium]|nr:cytochrome c oxidase subunit II [SAR202 cluster bacterium]